LQIDLKVLEEARYLVLCLLKYHRLHQWTGITFLSHRRRLMVHLLLMLQPGTILSRPYELKVCSIPLI
jgi:hypothetical protein